MTIAKNCPFFSIRSEKGKSAEMWVMGLEKAIVWKSF